MNTFENNAKFPKFPAITTRLAERNSSCCNHVEAITLDFALLEQIYADDTAYAHDIFETFLDQANFNYHTLKSTFHGADWIEFARLVHKVKPEYAFVGLTYLEKILDDMESLCKTRDNMLVLQRLFNEFEILHAPSIMAVKSHFITLKND